MPQQIRILILEDNASDVELIKLELRKTDLDYAIHWARDQKTFTAGMREFSPDIVLADYSLPGFDGMSALAIARDHHPEIPVIIVSGAIGEETAIETLKAGATDYVLKQRLRRLGPSIKRAIQEMEQTADRKRAEQALRESEERFRLLVDGAKDYAIFMIDDAGCVTTWNPGAQRIIGYSAEEIIGRSFARFFTEEDIAAGRPRLEMDIAAQNGEYADECWRVRKDGSRFCASVTLTLLQDTAGQPRGFAKIIRDITERKQAESALKSLNETLERRVEERTAEAHRRAEQLRQLAAELAFSEQRERQRLAQILHDGLQQILVGAKYHVALLDRPAAYPSAAKVIAELIDEAIRTSRSLTAELSPPVLLQTDLIAALKWLAHWMKEKHGLTVDLICRQKIKPLNQGIILLLFQATRELLFNTVKHSGVKTSRISVSRQAGGIAVTLEDDGAGFDPSRLSSDEGRVGGFGLFSLRERFAVIGGSMEIESAPGKGCKLKLTVPIAAAVRTGTQTS